MQKVRNAKPAILAVTAIPMLQPLRGCNSLIDFLPGTLLDEVVELSLEFCFCDWTVLMWIHFGDQELVRSNPHVTIVTPAFQIAGEWFPCRIVFETELSV